MTTVPGLSKKSLISNVLILGTTGWHGVSKLVDPIPRNWDSISIELLAKAHRSKLRITELPEKWPVRTSGVSKFKYYTIPFYFKWYLYILFSNFIRWKKLILEL